MNNMIAFIWDLDGTLLDAYGVIVNSLHQIYFEQGIVLNKEEILHDVITESVPAFTTKIEAKYGVSFATLKDHYSDITHSQLKDIKLIKHAKEILEITKRYNVMNFIVTHRGVSTDFVLKNLQIYDYFKEIITSLSGFPRKPNPHAIDYLVDKYHLDKEKTYYIGDRVLDIECASNAGIKSIMYLPPSSEAKANGKETYIVKDLLEVEDIIKDVFYKS